MIITIIIVYYKKLREIIYVIAAPKVNLNWNENYLYITIVFYIKYWIETLKIIQRKQKNMKIIQNT